MFYVHWLKIVNMRLFNIKVIMRSAISLLKQINIPKLCFHPLKSILTRNSG